MENFYVRTTLLFIVLALSWIVGPIFWYLAARPGGTLPGDQQFIEPFIEVLVGVLVVWPQQALLLLPGLGILGSVLIWIALTALYSRSLRRYRFLYAALGIVPAAMLLTHSGLFIARYVFGIQRLLA